MSQELQQRLEPVHVQHRIKKVNAGTAENAGTKRFQLLYMVNTKMFEFKNPQYYKNLRKLARLRNRNQAISRGDATAAGRRAPGTGLKLGEMDIASSKPQAPSSEDQASSVKPQALKLSNQPQASSAKRQASQPE